MADEQVTPDFAKSIFLKALNKKDPDAVKLDQKMRLDPEFRKQYPNGLKDEAGTMYLAREISKAGMVPKGTTIKGIDPAPSAKSLGAQTTQSIGSVAKYLGIDKPPEGGEPTEKRFVSKKKESLKGPPGMGGGEFVKSPLLGGLTSTVTAIANITKGLPAAKSPAEWIQNKDPMIEAGTNAQVSAGMVAGLADTGIQLTSLQNIGLLYGTGGFGLLMKNYPQKARLFGVLKGITEGKFSYDMLSGAAEEVPEALEAFRKGDWITYGRKISQAIGSALMGSSMGKEALKEAKIAVSKKGGGGTPKGGPAKPTDPSGVKATPGPPRPVSEMSPLGKERGTANIEHAEKEAKSDFARHRTNLYDLINNVAKQEKELDAAIQELDVAKVSPESNKQGEADLQKAVKEKQDRLTVLKERLGEPNNPGEYLRRFEYAKKRLDTISKQKETLRTAGNVERPRPEPLPPSRQLPAGPPDTPAGRVVPTSPGPPPKDADVLNDAVLRIDFEAIDRARRDRALDTPGTPPADQPAAPPGEPPRPTSPPGPLRPTTPPTRAEMEEYFKSKPDATAFDIEKRFGFQPDLAKAVYERWRQGIARQPIPETPPKPPDAPPAPPGPPPAPPDAPPPTPPAPNGILDDVVGETEARKAEKKPDAPAAPVVDEDLQRKVIDEIRRKGAVPSASFTDEGIYSVLGGAAPPLPELVNKGIIVKQPDGMYAFSEAIQKGAQPPAPAPAPTPKPAEAPKPTPEKEAELRQKIEKIKKENAEARKAKEKSAAEAKPATDSETAMRQELEKLKKENEAIRKAQEKPAPETDSEKRIKKEIEALKKKNEKIKKDREKKEGAVAVKPKKPVSGSGQTPPAAPTKPAEKAATKGEEKSSGPPPTPPAGAPEAKSPLLDSMEKRASDEKRNKISGTREFTGYDKDGKPVSNWKYKPQDVGPEGIKAIYEDMEKRGVVSLVPDVPKTRAEASRPSQMSDPDAPPVPWQESLKEGESYAVGSPDVSIIGAKKGEKVRIDGIEDGMIKVTIFDKDGEEVDTDEVPVASGKKLVDMLNSSQLPPETRESVKKKIVRP